MPNSAEDPEELYTPEQFWLPGLSHRVSIAYRVTRQDIIETHSFHNFAKLARELCQAMGKAAKDIDAMSDLNVIEIAFPSIAALINNYDKLQTFSYQSIGKPDHLFISGIHGNEMGVVRALYIYLKERLLSPQTLQSENGYLYSPLAHQAIAFQLRKLLGFLDLNRLFPKRAAAVDLQLNKLKYPLARLLRGMLSNHESNLHTIFSFHEDDDPEIPKNNGVGKSSGFYLYITHHRDCPKKVFDHAQLCSEKLIEALDLEKIPIMDGVEDDPELGYSITNGITYTLVENQGSGHDGSFESHAVGVMGEHYYKDVIGFVFEVPMYLKINDVWQVTPANVHEKIMKLIQQHVVVPHVQFMRDQRHSAETTRAQTPPSSVLQKQTTMFS